MLPEWQASKVQRIEELNSYTRRFWLQMPAAPVFAFKAGQFVTLDLPIHEQRNRRWRSYSIASPPDGTNVIELIITLVEGGAGTTYLFNEVAEGSKITARGPHGMFIMPEDDGEDLFLVCTGTGVAPFRSMAQYLFNESIARNGHTHLIFGCRTQADMLYGDELMELSKVLRNFHYHPTLSRDESWPGHKGYVHAIYEELCSERQAAHFMLCGWKAMIDEAKHRILEMGYEKKRIHLELYG